MEEKTKSNNLVTLTFGALIAIATAVFALVMQRIRRTSPPVAQDELTGSIQALPASAPDQYSPEAVPPGAPRPTTALRGGSRAPISRPGVPPPVSPPGAIGTPGAARGPRWSTPTKYIMGITLCLGALLLIIVGRGVIPMVIFAALLALFIDPFIHMLNRRLHLKWGSAVALTYVLVFVALLLIPLLVIPSLLVGLNFLFDLDFQQLANQAAQAVASFAASIKSNPALSTLLTPIFESLIEALKNFSVQEQMQTAVADITLASLSSFLASSLGTLVGIVGPVVSVVVSTVITLIMALHMSLASNQISGWYPDLIPPAYKSEYSELLKDITQTWTSFLRGQLTLMLIIGFATWLGCLALGVPYAILMAILAGLLELIPNIGPTLAAIPAVLLSLIFGSTYLPIDNLVFALIVVAFYVLIQFLENQFIVPYVMGDAVDLPPLIVLIGTIGGAMAFGILGALLATPVIATANLLFQFIYRKILEPPPLPPEPEEKPSAWEAIKGWAGRIPVTIRKRLAPGSKPATLVQPK